MLFVKNLDAVTGELPDNAADLIAKNILLDALNVGIIPPLNDKLSVGIPLPTIKGVSLNNAELEVMDGYVVVKASLAYTPEEEIGVEEETSVVLTEDRFYLR